jgi:hypothetical protein
LDYYAINGYTGILMLKISRLLVNKLSNKEDYYSSASLIPWEKQGVPISVRIKVSIHHLLQ